MADFVFLDSGTGGIPYLTYLLGKLPHADCVYVGDTKNFPYGEKNHEEIVKCVLDIAKKIIEKFNPKVFIIACNTMSVNTLDVLREAFPETQFVGTVPAIKVASEVSKKRTVGLLATRSTVEHPYNIDLKNHFASDCRLILRADPDLISFIEKKSFTATKDECKAAVLPAVKYFAEQKSDTMILGCTHFLNLADLIQEVADEVTGGELKVIDSREGVVNRAISIFNSTGGISSDGEYKAKLFITGLAEEKDKEEYDVICKRYSLEWGGVI
ncbi:MAG: glutamate racemase [Treponema sp.]|nr:glutamate racemase [Candidatus Treponema merdequi]